MNGTFMIRAPKDSHTGTGWHTLWFLIHLVAVYAIVNFVTPGFAGWIHGRILPLLHHPSSSGSFEFFFSHIIVVSVVPAFLTGLVNAKFRHKAAEFVWIVPVAILTYRFFTFPAPSVLQSRLPAAFLEYFGGGFVVPEFNNWREFWAIVGTNSDMTRGMEQVRYTAPFYAGVAYSVAAWLGRRAQLSRRATQAVRRWEHSRFGHSA